jgi:hypothetical protein
LRMRTPPSTFTSATNTATCGTVAGRFNHSLASVNCYSLASVNNYLPCLCHKHSSSFVISPYLTLVHPPRSRFSKRPPHLWRSRRCDGVGR